MTIDKGMENMSTSLRLVITETAKHEIRLLTDNYSKRIDRAATPALMWIDAHVNEGLKISQPAIGFYNDRAEIEHDIEIIDGIEIVIAVPEEDRSIFDHKVLDYVGGCFILQ
jgi:hypothetical protein